MVQAEIDIIKAMGVEIKTGIEVGKDITIEEADKIKKEQEVAMTKEQTSIQMKDNQTTE